MGAEVDSLEIAVQTTANEANKSLDTLIKKIGLVAEGISALTKDSGLSDFAKKISELSKSGELAKGLTSLGNAKGAAKAGDNIAKSFADSIIKGYKIRDKEVQSSIREMTQSLAKMSMGEIASGMDNPEFLNTFDKLGETVKKNAHIVSSQMGIFDDFYKYFQGLGKIDIPKNVIAELGDDWKKMRMTSSKSFSTDGSGIELDSIYQEMSDKFKGIFSGTADQTEQFREIISAVQAYRADIDKLEPVDPEKITGFEDGMWDDLYDGLKTMREKITAQMSGIAQDISRTAEEIRQQYADLGKSFTMSGSENQIERKINSLTNSLENAKLKQQELEASGNTGGKAYESTIASIVKYENQIESLKNQLESLKQVEAETANVSANTTPSGHDPNVFSGTITGLGNDSKKDIESTRQSVKVAVSDMQYNAQAMAQTFGEAAQGIRDWAQATAQYGSQAGQALNNPEILQQVNQQTQAIQQQAHNLSSEIQNMKNMIVQSFSDLANGSMLRNLAGSFPAIGQAAQKAGQLAQNAFKGMAVPLNLAKKSVVSLAKSLKSGIANSFSKLGSSVKQSGNSLLKNLFTIIRYTAGIRTLYTAVRKLRTAFVDGMNNLVKYSQETNASVSLLWNSMNQLKNSVAAAAAPLVNALAPALNTIIQLCISAANAINQVLSALTGHGTWIKATKQTKDYAKSLGGASKAADDLKTHTLGIDELNVVDQSKSGGSGGGGASANATDMFDTQEIDSKYQEWADKIKSMWEVGDFTELGTAVGQWIKNGLDSIQWDGIQESARRIASSIGTFINGFVETEGLATSIGTTIGEAINTAVDFTNTLLDVTHFDSIGKFIGDGLNGVVNTIQWDEIGQMFANGFNAMFEVIGNLATTFDWTNFGSSLALGFNTFVSTFKWTENGADVSAVVTGLLDTLITFVDEADWSAFGEGVMDFIEGIDWGGLAERLVSAAGLIVEGLFNFLIGAVTTINWQQLGMNIFNELLKIVTTFDYASLVSTGFNLFGAIIGASFALIAGVAQAVWNMLVAGFNATKAYFDGYIQDAGGNIILGLFNGIVDALKSVGQWIIDNIFTPFINGFKDAFGIHSPSTIMSDMGGYLMAGLLNGVKEGWNAIKEGVGKVAQSVIDKFKDILGIHSPSTVMDENGVYLVEGLKNGINGTMDDVYSLFSKSKWKEIGQEMLDGLTEPFKGNDGIDTIKDFATKAVNSISETLSAEQLGTIGSAAVTALGNSFTTSALDPIFNNIKTSLMTAWNGTAAWWSGTAMPTFFSANVSPWFTAEKWKSVTAGMKTGIIAKWDEFVSQWKTKINSWWNTGVKPWFTVEKWKEQGDHFKTALTDKWIEFQTQWDTNINAWFTSHVSTWFTKEKWEPFGTNMKDGIYDGFKGIVSKVGEIINSMIDLFNTGLSRIAESMNDLISDYNESARELGEESLSHVTVKTIARVDIPKYSVGGFPEDGLFYANHNEMVGRFSNGQTAVANNEQIVAGIASGVKEAVTEVLAPYLSQIADNTRETANKDTSISLDGRELVSAINSRVSRNGFSFT